MVAKIIDGKVLAKTIRKDIAITITNNVKLGQKAPGLAVILIGDDPASHIYVSHKRHACSEAGIKSIYHHLPVTITEDNLIILIHTLNNDESIDGILIQLPLPAHICEEKIFETIKPCKDVDGFHPYNIGRLAQRHPLLRPCTPYGIMVLLDSIQQTYKNRHAVIIGASNIVGRPMAMELLLAGCTITVCHRFTESIKDYVKQGDIIISAVGKPNIIKGHWIKEGATVIDVGISRLADGTVTGDVEFNKAFERAGFITPVPGGVGPMTVAMLLKNTLFCKSIK